MFKKLRIKILRLLIEQKVFGGGTVNVNTTMTARHLRGGVKIGRREKERGFFQKLKGKIIRYYGGSVIKVTTKTIARHLRDGKEIGKRVVLNKKVTTAFVNDIVDNLIAEASAFGDYKFHDSGTGVVAENASDTALGTPWGGARDTGTQIEGAQTYEYKSVATTTYTGTFAITEHGLFNIAVAGILMDRTVFTSIGVENNDQIEFTFTIQFSAEA